MPVRLAAPPACWASGHDDTARTSPPRLLGFPTPQVFVKCTGYLLGEYGPLLSAAGEVPLLDQFQLLQERFVAATPETKVGCSRAKPMLCSWPFHITRGKQVCVPRASRQSTAAPCSSD